MLITQPTNALRLTLDALEAREVPSVTYHGGALLTHVEAQAVYLGSEWAAPSVAGQPGKAALDASLSDLVQASTTNPNSGAFMQALSRAGYGAGTGTTSAGMTDNMVFSAAATVTDATIRARLSADITSGLLQPPDANRLFVVYVQPNVAVNLNGTTTQQGVLGYHGAFTGPTGLPVRYAVVAYPGGAVGNSGLGTAAADQLTAVASHEVAEAATDPDVNYRELGWYDDQLNGEIGDITENKAGSLVRTDGYLVQLEADKNDQMLSIAPPLSPPPASPPVVPPPPASPPVVVQPPATPSIRPTTTTLTGRAVANPFGIPEAALTATVAASSAPVSGTVALLANGTVVGYGTLRTVNGVSQVTFDVQFRRPGQYNFTVQYLGTAQWAPSLGNPLTVNVS